MTSTPISSARTTSSMTCRIAAAVGERLARVVLGHVAECVESEYQLMHETVFLDQLPHLWRNLPAEQLDRSRTG